MSEGLMYGVLMLAALLNSCRCVSVSVIRCNSLFNILIIKYNMLFVFISIQHAYLDYAVFFIIICTFGVCFYYFM